MKNVRYPALYGAFTLAGACLLPTIALSASVPSTASEFRILHHEPLSGFYFSKPNSAVNSPSVAAQTSVATLASFTAFGKTFNLELLPNDALLDNLPSLQKRRLKQTVQIYQGKIADNANSWVRINRTGTHVSGAFWDGEELYIIDTSDQIGKALSAGIGSRARSARALYGLVYKMSDTVSNAICALELDAKPLSDFQGLVKELKGKQLAALAQANQKLDVAVITDAEFNQANAADPQAAVVARMNVVDGIYTNQLGVHINLSQILALKSNGNLNTTDAVALVEQLSKNVNSPSFNNPGLTHLFTGRNLDGDTVGISYVSGLCSKQYGVGLSQIDGTGTAGALIIAHEIGHNFGADHDNQAGYACASTPGTFLMNPYVNGSSQFSPCSLQSIAPVMAHASCLAPYQAAADVRLAIPVNPINASVAKSFKYRVEVRNGGTIAAKGSSVAISIPTGLVVSTATSNGGKCSKSTKKVTCALGTLAPNVTRIITITLKGAAKPVRLISAITAAASNDSNKKNNTAKVSINIR